MHSVIRNAFSRPYVYYGRVLHLVSMNDLTQLVISFVILLAGIIIGLIIDTVCYSHECAVLMILLGAFGSIAFFLLTDNMINKNFDAIPYNNTPEAEYQLTEANIPIYQTGSDYLNFTYDNVDTPVLQIYGRNDGGVEWLGRDQKKRVTVILPERYKTSRNAVDP